MTSVTAHKQKTPPLGLVYRHNAQVVTSATAAPKTNVPVIHKRRPNLEGAPSLKPAHAQKQKPAPKPMPQPKALVLAFSDPRLRDVANDLPYCSGREAMGKVMAGAKARQIDTRNMQVPQFTANAMSMSARSKIVPFPEMAARPSATTPKISVGGPSVLTSMFGRHPLAGTGLVRQGARSAPVAANSMKGWSAPRPRFAA